MDGEGLPGNGWQAAFFAVFTSPPLQPSEPRMPRNIPSLSVTPTSPDTCDQHRLATFAHTFGIDTSAAVGLTGKELTAWLDAAEDAWIASAVDTVLAIEPTDTAGGVL